MPEADTVSSPDENLVMLRHGLTAVNDRIGCEPAVHIQGLDDKKQAIVLRLDAHQVKKLSFLIEVAGMEHDEQH